MSTKNLARTVIEAGRMSSGSWACREANARFRREVRVRLVAAAGGQSDEVLYPVHKKTNRHLDDKLSPAKRWLASQVGRPWNLVRGELFSRFDTRTTAGRHIVFGHMLRWVKTTTVAGCCDYYAHFQVDRHGILRTRQRERYVYPRRPEPLPSPAPDLERWLDGRRVGARGELLFWFVPTAGNAFRQHHRLEEADVARWRALPEWFREKNGT